MSHRCGAPVHVPAAVSPRLASTEYSHRSRGVAANPVCGISATRKYDRRRVTPPAASSSQAEFFLGKANGTLADAFAAARAAQRADAAAETKRALTGEGHAPPGNYARRHMDAVLSALPDEVLRPLLDRQAVSASSEGMR